MGTVKTYETENVKVIWKPGSCIHSAKCVEGLPGVFKPKEKPWINLEDCDEKMLMKTIDKCPSGALTYELKTENKKVMDSNDNIKINVMENGPVLVHGEISLTLSDGSAVSKSKVTAFCRCGASKNKPFCDGMHKDINFKAE
ncbi:MAG: hypothetical protein BM564_11045 [Bacteroidetes bacterium MedPE-SWsnd-G2]|nr:MAG: hypothetical protein BM564_11045 [Bacteroidetes bacterium MedPE-SWsnd-G2]